MDDIQTVLTRWGVWARDNAKLDYPHIANGFKGVVSAGRSLESYSDNDGLKIDVTIGNLQRATRDKELGSCIQYVDVCLKVIWACPENSYSTTFGTLDYIIL